MITIGTGSTIVTTDDSISMGSFSINIRNSGMNRIRLNVLNNHKEREETMVRPENYTVIDLEMTGL